jgi:hypothetical protein
MRRVQLVVTINLAVQYDCWRAGRQRLTRHLQFVLRDGLKAIASKKDHGTKHNRR